MKAEAKISFGVFIVFVVVVNVFFLRVCMMGIYRIYVIRQTSEEVKAEGKVSFDGGFFIVVANVSFFACMHEYMMNTCDSPNVSRRKR